LDPLGTCDHVQTGQDDAFIHNYNTGADAPFFILAGLLVLFHASHTYNGRPNDFVCLCRSRWQSRRLQGVKHCGVDIFLGNLTSCRHEYGVGQHDQQSETAGSADPQNPFVALAQLPPPLSA